MKSTCIVADVDKSEDEEQHVDEEEAVNVDAEDDDEERLQFIDSDYEQTDEEQERQKGAEDDRWFNTHVVEEAAEEPQRELGEVPSDDYNSEDLLSISEEEDEVVEKLGVKKVSRRRKAPRFKQFKRYTNLFNLVFHIGMEFANMEQCREAIRFYAVSSARPLRWVKNDPHRVRVNAEDDGGEENGENGGEKGKEKRDVKCDWLLYASYVGKGPTTRIKTYQPKHSCGRMQKTKFATSSWLAQRFDEDLRDNPNMSVTNFMKIARVRGRGRGTSMPSVPVRQLDQAETSIQDRPLRRTKLGSEKRGQTSELTRQLAQTGATLQGIQIGHASQPNSENVPLPKRPRPWRV
ncbi:hypothetical protein ACE6H2_026780 [Prunus campanulata]